jgi:GTP-binding protein
MLRHFSRPFLVVGTKSDRVSGNELRNSIQKLMAEHAIDRIIPFSKLGLGKDDVRKEIREAAEKVAPQSTGTAETPTTS